MKILDKMKQTNKQIDYAIEILNEDFFEKLRSCQILHLRPKLYNQDFIQDNDKLSIEGKQFKEILVDHDQMALFKNLVKRGLKITYVILEIPNCKKLA